MRPYSIRGFNHGDIEFALAQTTREGWDPTVEFFELCLAHDPDGNFIAEFAGQAVGLITTTRYARTAWVGNLIVTAEHRHQGLGRALMTHAMQHLASRGVRTIRLEADPAGIKLYRRLGFVDQFDSLRFQLSAQRSVGRAGAAQVAQADVPTIASFDAEQFGDDRRRLLELLFRQARAAYWLRAEREVRGYAFLTPSRLGLRLGPLVAVDQRAAETLLRTCLGARSDQTLLLAVQSPNRTATTLLESYGFKRSGSCLRMLHGPDAAASHYENIFAIANGAMG